MFHKNENNEHALLKEKRNAWLEFWTVFTGPETIQPPA